MPADFRPRVLAVVKRLGPGQVASYGDVAAEAGFPGAARAVGAVLATPANGDPMPWWRVVYADGRLSPGNERKQAQLLVAEGVKVRSGRVVLRPGAR
jgi:methylated-DNA-protein-cysteine methyltransferase related protein